MLNGFSELTGTATLRMELKNTRLNLTLQEFGHLLLYTLYHVTERIYFLTLRDRRLTSLNNIIPLLNNMSKQNYDILYNYMIY